MLFNPEIQSIEEDILYHEQQIKEAQERLDQVKVSQAYSDTVISSLEDFFENTDPFLYEVLKGHIEQMFDENKLTLNNDFNQADAQEVEKEEAPQKEPILEENYLPKAKEVEQKETPTKPEKEFGSLSYYELTGKPDLRPETYEDLAPNVVYSNNGRAYIGFNDRSRAEKFRDSISEPSLLGDENTMNGFEYEVKLHCQREYAQELADSINSMSEDVEDTQTPNFEKIDGEIIYNHADSICYVAGRAKGRLDNYGSYLTRILDIGDKYTVSNKPTMFDSKYELRIEGIDFSDALHLQDFNLLKEYDHSVNEEARSLWRDSRKRVYPSACKPSPKLISPEEVKLGDIIYLNSIDNQYKVLQKVNCGGVPHLEVICTYNSERPSLVGLTSFLKECYLVDPEEIRVDTLLQRYEEEEVLTEDVQIYVPKEKETAVKKSEILDFLHES